MLKGGRRAEEQAGAGGGEAQADQDGADQGPPEQTLLSMWQNCPLTQVREYINLTQRQNCPSTLVREFKFNTVINVAHIRQEKMGRSGNSLFRK